MNFDSTSFAAKTAEMNKKIAAMRAAYQVEAQAAFAEATKEFFIATPEISTLEWTQYTPYFNDGDECTFRVGDVWYYLNTQNPEDFDYGEEAGFQGRVDDVGTIVKEINNFKDILNGSVIVPHDKRGSYPYYYFFDTVRKYNQPIEYSLNVKSLEDKIEELEDRVKGIEAETALYANRKTVEANYGAIASFIRSLDDEVMKDMFGDHVMVRVNKDGVQISEYDHD